MDPARTREDWVPGQHREGNRRHVSPVVIEGRPSAFDRVVAVLDQRSDLSHVLELPQQGDFTNKGFYSNPAIDKLLDDNIREGDLKKRDAGAKEAQRILLEDAVWGLLWYDNWARVMRSDMVGVEKLWDSFERFNKLKLA